MSMKSRVTVPVGRSAICCILALNSYTDAPLGGWQPWTSDAGSSSPYIREAIVAQRNTYIALLQLSEYLVNRYSEALE